MRLSYYAFGELFQQVNYTSYHFATHFNLTTNRALCRPTILTTSFEAQGYVNLQTTSLAFVFLSPNETLLKSPNHCFPLLDSMKVQ
ncbi:hypothetical protein L1987_19900 [Smallanthus sonchifolius]|uniref:Uncharacterized protein n=1 Tax=Smallanthus sonchifolius TaxID=185202 RepID=A0ACB9IQS5_9ASTR|nr:hypothetical protein L1987_19900 [Smallanthus sonchifolius]